MVCQKLKECLHIGKNRHQEDRVLREETESEQIPDEYFSDVPPNLQLKEEQMNQFVSGDYQVKYVMGNLWIEGFMNEEEHKWMDNDTSLVNMQAAATGFYPYPRNTPLRDIAKDMAKYVPETENLHLSAISPQLCRLIYTTLKENPFTLLKTVEYIGIKRVTSAELSVLISSIDCDNLVFNYCSTDIVTLLTNEAVQEARTVIIRSSNYTSDILDMQILALKATHIKIICEVKLSIPGLQAFIAKRLSLLDEQDILLRHGFGNDLDDQNFLEGLDHTPHLQGVMEETKLQADFKDRHCDPNHIVHCKDGEVELVVEWNHIFIRIHTKDIEPGNMLSVDDLRYFTHDLSQEKELENQRIDVIEQVNEVRRENKKEKKKRWRKKFCLNCCVL